MITRMPQSEDCDVKKESEPPLQNERTEFRAGQIVITPRRLLRFIISFIICLAVSILLVRWILK